MSDRPFYASRYVLWYYEGDRVVLRSRRSGMWMGSVAVRTCLRSLEMSTAGPNSEKIKAALKAAMEVRS